MLGVDLGWPPVSVVSVSARTYFAIVPSRAFDLDLDNAAIVALTLLASYCDSEGLCDIPTEEMAQRRSVSRRALLRQLKLLVDKGLVSSTQTCGPTGGRGPTEYRIIYDRPKPTVPQVPKPTVPQVPKESEPTVPQVPALLLPTRRTSKEVLKPFTESKDDSAGQFDEFWDAYPKRGGYKGSKKLSKEAWGKLTVDERGAALIGVKHYRAHCDAGETLSKDAERWLRHKLWADWQEPIAVVPRGAATMANYDPAVYADPARAKF